jgi:hypothetical protein
MQLVIEMQENMKIRINNTDLTQKCGKWIDVCFDKFDTRRNDEQ